MLVCCCGKFFACRFFFRVFMFYRVFSYEKNLSRSFDVHEGGLFVQGVDSLCVS